MRRSPSARFGFRWPDLEHGVHGGWAAHPDGWTRNHMNRSAP